MTTKYVRSYDPREFEKLVNENQERGFRIVHLMVRPRADGTVFCFAKLRLTFIGVLRRRFRAHG